VKLCKNGEWITITIDDFFPCYPDNTPIFSRAINNQIWVLLLEKAYAKLHGKYINAIFDLGNYLLLRGGLASEALYDLTGCPTIYYNFHDEYVREMLKNGHLWQKMKEYDGIP
jgi:calpain-15